MIRNDLRSVQLVQLNLLKVLDAICKKHNLCYWLDAGTLLGAARHQGAIPWDDDIDVAMPSADYHKFLQIAEKELPTSVFLETNKNGPLKYFRSAKLRDNNSLYISYTDYFNKPYHRGAFLDIFEFVNYPNIPQSVIRFFVKMIGKPVRVLTVAHELNLKSVLQYFVFNAYKFIFKPIWSFICLFKSKKYISNPIENNIYGIKHKVEYVFPLTTMLYEGEYFSAPHSYDLYLKTLYGDYMTPPPESKRKGHAYAYFVNLNDKGSDYK